MGKICSILVSENKIKSFPIGIVQRSLTIQDPCENNRQNNRVLKEERVLDYRNHSVLDYSIIEITRLFPSLFAINEKTQKKIM